MTGTARVFRDCIIPCDLSDKVEVFRRRRRGVPEKWYGFISVCVASRHTRRWNCEFLHAAIGGVVAGKSDLLITQEIYGIRYEFLDIISVHLRAPNEKKLVTLICNLSNFFSRLYLFLVLNNLEAFEDASGRLNATDL